MIDIIYSNKKVLTKEIISIIIISYSRYFN